MDNLPTPEPGNVHADYYYAEDASTQTTERDFFLLEHTRDATTQTNDEYFRPLGTKKEACTQTIEEDFIILEHIHSIGNNFTVTSDTYEQTRKRCASGDLILTQVSDTHKRSRSEICGLSDTVSTFSEQGDENPDSRLHMIPSNRIALENSSLPDINPEFPNIEESHSHNQEMKAIGYLLINRNFTPAASSMTIFQKENSSETLPEFWPWGRNIFPTDETYAIPGPSWSHENICRLNINPEKFPNNIPLKPLQIVKKRKTNCRTCTREIVRYDNECTGRNSKVFCKCIYKCNICGVRYREEGSHEIEHTCNVCQKNFLCKTQMEDHYLIHEKHHMTYCRICCRKINEHVIKNETIAVKTYKCCQFCPYASEDKTDFRKHLYTHSDLKLFKCKQCGWQFTVKVQLQKHFKYSSNCSG